MRDFNNYQPGLEGKHFAPLRTRGRAKMCDHMCAAAANFPRQMIISHRFAQLFKCFAGQELEQGLIQITHRGKAYDYVCQMLTRAMPKEIIDFQRSRIAMNNWMEQRFDPLECETMEEFMATQDAVFVNVAFREEFIRGLHYFLCPVINRMFMSDEMAEAMVAEKITGLDLYTYDETSDITSAGIRKLPRVL